MTERSELFRSEAVRHKSDHTRSVPVFQQNRIMSIFVAFAMLMLLCSLLLLVVIDYQETESARGVLQTSGGTLKVVAPRMAVASAIEVEEGEQVAKGQLLVVLSTAGFDGSGQHEHASRIQHYRSERIQLRKQQTLSVLQHEQKQGRNKAGIASLESSLSSINKEAVILHRQLDLSEAANLALENLLQQSAISRMQYDQSYHKHLDLLLRVQQMEQHQQQTKAALENERTQQQEFTLQLERDQLTLQMQLEEIDFQIEDLLSQESISVLAETSGIVAAIAIEPGQAVIPNQPLLYLHGIDKTLTAILYAPSRIAGKLAPGQSVLLSYDAFDYQHFGRYAATILTLDQASLDPREHLLPIGGLSEPVFRVVASLTQQYVEGPDIYRLQAGMQLSADFVIAEMSLLEFVFKPLLKLRARVT